MIVIESLFIKLPWPGESEGTFRSSSQAATCPPLAVEASQCLFLIVNSSSEDVNRNFTLLGLTRPGIEPTPIVSVVDALFTLPLIGSS